MSLQEKLALACRILAMQGHNDMIYGHVSALTDTPGQYWIKGSGIGLEEVTEDDLVLIDFWGTWCQPCIRSVPHLVELQKRMGVGKLKVVGIACEQGPPAERAKTVAQEVRRLGINYPVLLSGMDGPCPLQEALKVQAYPTLILVDRQGRIVWRDQGATPVTLARLDRILGSANKGDEVRRY